MQRQPGTVAWLPQIGKLANLWVKVGKQAKAINFVSVN